jgi:YidC/Oxa1 family membrane protein insertase
MFDLPVTGAYHLVHWMSSPAGVPVAIVVFTIAVRLLLHPLSRAAVRGEKARAVLMPRIAELQKRHAKDPERLRREVAELQSENGSLLVGCLPMLAQLPFFWVMYRLFSAGAIAGHPNALLAGTLFGAPLGVHWPVLTGTAVFLGLAVLLVVVAWFSVRLQARRTTTAAPVLLRFLPYGTVVTAAFVPLAAGLYLLTTTAWTVAERALLYR